MPGGGDVGQTGLALKKLALMMDQRDQGVKGRATLKVNLSKIGSGSVSRRFRSARAASLRSFIGGDGRQLGLIVRRRRLG